MADIGGAAGSGKFKAFGARFMDGKIDQKNPEQKLRDVSDMYEKHFLREMTKAMRSTVHEGGFIQSNQAEKIFREQLDEHYVEKWGERGGIGLSDLIYKQLVDKFGQKMGINSNSTDRGNSNSNFLKPQGPLPLGKSDNSNLEFRLQPFQHPGKKDSVSYRIDILRAGGKTVEKNNFDQSNERVQSLNAVEAVKMPWDGVLLGKKTLADNQIMFELEHDNGLKSQMVFKGNSGEVEKGVEVGGTLQAGDTLGFLSDGAKSLYWTVEKAVTPRSESRPETVSE